MKTDFIAERAKQLKLSSLSISRSLRMGTFNSAFRGRGIEFDSVREYQIGDDVRSIDWNLTARSTKAYIKEYKEERDLTIFLCVDFSASMKLGTMENMPRTKALETAALLAFSALNISSPVGAIFFAGEKGPLYMPQSSEEHILTILRSMEEFAMNEADKQKSGTQLAGALKAISKILRSRSMVIIISDFKVEGYEKDLGLLASKNDVVCIKLSNSLDTELPQAGTMLFQDTEGEFRTSIQTTSNKFKREYKENFYEQVSRWERSCNRAQAYPLLLNTKADTVKTLTEFFQSKENNKRINKFGVHKWKAF